MLILYNKDRYIEYIVDGICWCYPMKGSRVIYTIDQESPLLLLTDKEKYPYLYWVWSS